MTEQTPGPDLVAFAADMFTLAREGTTDSLAAYVDAGVPVDLANDRGDTLLMLAAYHGHTDLVDALIARGADVNLANDRGQTPVAGAIFKGQDAVVRSLVKAGADLDAGTPSARETAEMFGRTELLG